MALLLGLDIGTTSTIGIVIDDRGATLAVESRPVTFHSDRANWAEEDPEEWWRNVGEICRALIAKIGDAGAIAAVGVTGMLPAVILLDRDGRILRRSIQQNDARATDGAAALSPDDGRIRLSIPHRDRLQPAAGRAQTDVAARP